MAPHDITAMVSDAEDTADTVEHAGHRLGIKRIAQGDGMALAQVDRTYGFETYPALGSIPFTACSITLSGFFASFSLRGTCFSPPM